MDFSGVTSRFSSPNPNIPLEGSLVATAVDYTSYTRVREVAYNNGNSCYSQTPGSVQRRRILRVANCRYRLSKFLAIRRKFIILESVLSPQPVKTEHRISYPRLSTTVESDYYQLCQRKVVTDWYFRIYRNIFLRRLLGLTLKDLTRDCRRTANEELHNLYP